MEKIISGRRHPTTRFQTISRYNIVKRTKYLQNNVSESYSSDEYDIVDLICIPTDRTRYDLLKSNELKKKTLKVLITYNSKLMIQRV